MKQHNTTAFLAESIFIAMNKRDFSGVSEYIHDHIIFSFPGIPVMESKKKVLLGLKVILRKYPELTFTITDIITEGNKACVVWTNKGRDIYGAGYTNSGVTVFRMEEGKIAYISDYFKDTSFTEKVKR